MAEILKISNDWILWIICFPLVAIVVLQAYMFVKLARKEAAYINYPQKKLNEAIRNGAITSIGPALATVVVMLSMMAVIGGPITWQKMNDIGAAQTELTVAKVAAEAMGTQLGAASYTVGALTLCFLMMAMNDCGWLITTSLFTPRMETVREKISGGNMKWLLLLTAGSNIGLFSHLCSQQVVGNMGGASMAAVIAFITQFVIDNWISKKYKWTKSYAITFALIIGILIPSLIFPL